MDTIIWGDNEKAKCYKFFKCDRCGWVGRADNTEYAQEDFQLSIYYTVKCPTCGRKALEEKDKELIEKYKKKLEKQQRVMWIY